MTFPPAAADTRPAAQENRSRGMQPARCRFSVRRTSSLQTSWPQGATVPARMVGRARDLFTGDADQPPQVLGQDWVVAELATDKRILELEGSRRQEVLRGFAGMYPGGEMRKAMATALADEAQEETRLHRLLDDMAGAAFMATAAWYAWPGGLEDYFVRTGTPSVMSRPVTGVCMSYVPGSVALRSDGTGNEDIIHHAIAPRLADGGEPWSFHELVPETGPNQWRLRRTDIWHEGEDLCVDSWFQDSSVLPDDPGHRLVFHEYSLRARLDLRTLELRGVDVEPHVLPYLSCRASPATAKRLEGLRASDLRTEVPRMLRGTAGCTHLNDMLRALQDIVGLSGVLARI